MLIIIKLSRFINYKFISFRVQQIAKDESCVPEKQKSVIILEEEQRVFQSLRLEHIQILEKFNEVNRNLQTIIKTIPKKGIFFLLSLNNNILD